MIQEKFLFIKCIEGMLSSTGYFYGECVSTGITVADTICEKP